MSGSANSRIRYLSPPAPVEMNNAWYELATLDHFWIQRRFDVLCRLMGGKLKDAHRMAEIGCGHGVLQRQVEDRYGRPVAGFDLNELPLARSISRTSDICCYDIRERREELRGAFDIILLFDVLEHIEDEDGFLDAIRFHMALRGSLVISVPASPALYSAYDRLHRHFRRYLFDELNRVAERNEFAVSQWTYWGLPLVPLLAVRKLWVATQPDERVIATGFAPPNPLVNRLLRGLSGLETIPQHFFGGSLMAVLEDRGHGKTP